MKSNGNEFVKMNQIIDEMAAGKVNRTSNVDGDIEAIKGEITQHDAAMNSAAAIADAAAYNAAKADKEAAETRLAMLEKHRDAVNKSGSISDDDAKAFVNSGHQIQDAALRKAYQETVNGVEKAIRAIEDAERLVSDGNDVLTRFDEEIKPLAENDGTMHVIHMNNKVLRNTRELTAFKESIVDGRAFEYVKDEANTFFNAISGAEEK